jgi:hypothetical protein
LINCFNQGNKDDVVQLICQNVQGVAVSTAKEIEREFLEIYQSDNQKFGEKLFEKLNDYLFNTPKNPCVFIKQNQVSDVCVYPYKNADSA